MMRSMVCLASASLLLTAAPAHAKPADEVAEQLAVLDDADKAPASKALAMLKLGQLGPKAEKAVPTLAKLAASDSDDVQLRLWGVMTLGKIGKPASTPLGKLVKDKAVGNAALEELGKMKGEGKSAAKDVIAVILDGYPKVLWEKEA